MRLNAFEKFVERNSEERGLNLAWNMYHLSKNPSITENFIKKHMNGINYQKWDLLGLLFDNPNISIIFFIYFLWKNKLYNSLLFFPFIFSILFLIKIIGYLEKIIGNKNFFQQKKPKNITKMSSKNLRKYFKKYPEELSTNPYITADFMEKHSEDIRKGNWNMIFLSSNPNVTPRLIEKYGVDFQKWNWYSYRLSGNTFATAIKEDEEIYKSKIYFLSTKDGTIFNFRKDFLYDPNLNKLIFSYL